MLHAGDCLEVLASLPEASVDAVVTDPPYHLASIVKRFGKEGAAPARAGTDGAFQRASRGFMGKQWDGGEIAHRPETWAAVMRALKPGGHCVAFHASRNWAFQTVAMAQAGFELRDTIIDLFDPSEAAAAFIETLSPEQAEPLAQLAAAADPLADLFWIYGTGFPKGLDVAKGIDKRLLGGARGAAVRRGSSFGQEYERTDKGAPITDEARRWDGWNAALKPAFEPIVLARKPLAEGSIVEQVLATGTGAINVGGCRIGDEPRSAAFTILNTPEGNGLFEAKALAARRGTAGAPKIYIGRWPANVTHDGSGVVESAFPALDDPPSRFFFSAKADGDDRVGSHHPTVKPIALMRWLVRLVTPQGGVVLDPFAGTGTTAEAALLEGFSAVLIEREAEYRADIARRMGLVFEGAGARAKAKALRAPRGDAMPLFAAAEAAGADAPEGGAGGSTADSQIRTGGGSPFDPTTRRPSGVLFAASGRSD